ncbi:uncharacterized protein ofcc1 isoform X4 [Leucoraja erinacea]|uniref:uncharacterized protein ofcc1 isoform X4 n=1 Tax=Leucoraja erinaceus TaxID=7782 RepID=UPI0024542FA7|nr:uncharacterized protein ofcc1 isoform X4 [Leucoraja erinacea]
MQVCALFLIRYIRESIVLSKLKALKLQHKPGKQTEQKKSKSAEFLMEPDRSDIMDLYLKLLELTEDELGTQDARGTETTGACMRCESAGVCSNILGLRQEVEKEMIPPYVEQFETSVQDDMILVGSLSLEQAQDQRQRFCDAHMDCWSQEEHLVEQQKLSVKTQEEDAKQRVMAFARDKTKSVKPQEINSEQSEFLQARLRTAFQNAENQLLKALENRGGEVRALYGDLTEVNHQYDGVQDCHWKVEWSGTPQPVHIQLKCLRGVKDKLPKGWYILRVSLLSRLGGFPLRWSNSQHQHWAEATSPVYHDGNFYNVELSFNQSIAVVLPSVNELKAGMTLIFELFLLHGINSSIDRAVAWGAFPVCNGKLEILEGKYKCPFLRGHQDHKIDEFRKIEALMSSDVDHWVCNLYLQIIKLPKSLVGLEMHAVELQLPRQLLRSPECSNANKRMEASGNPVDTIPDLKVVQPQHTDFRHPHLQPKCSSPSVPAQEQNTCGSSSECAKKSDELIRASGESGVFLKESHQNLAEFNRKDKRQSTVEQSTSPPEPLCLEDLAQYRFSVVSDSSLDKTMDTLAWHAWFVSQMFVDQLRALHWCSPETWLFVLLVALIWFVRLYLHYCSQWIYLQAIGVTVNKFHFYPHTVELSYQNSLLAIHAELTIVALGPLTLNVTLLIMAMIRLGCHVRSVSFPSFLSRLFMAMGFWTALDPLAIFIVDGILGRLTYSTNHPIGDAAKLYWLFYRTHHSGIPGILITVILYIVILLCSLTILYLYLLSLQSTGHLHDVFYRLHSTEERFFVPRDLELSNQELSYIVKRAAQWRGINSERRKVAVYDYIRNNDLIACSSQGCRPQEQNETPGSLPGRRDITTHVSIYIRHLNDIQELYRHFHRLPDGAIVEVFDAESSASFMRQQVSGLDTEQQSSTSPELRERQKKIFDAVRTGS